MKNIISKLEDMFGKDVWSSFMKDYPEDVLEVKRGFESKKYVIKESSNDTISMKFPVTLLDVLNEKRQSKGTMAEYIKQTTYSHSVMAINDKVRFKNDFIKECFTKSVEEIINHLKMLFSYKKLRGKSIGTILMVGGFSQSPVLYDRIKSAFPNMEAICP
jgi:actin-related protein